VRELLDERGVEYETYIEPQTGFEHVKWNFNEHGSADFNLEFGEPWLTMYGTISGPEQAIAATLGSCNCTNGERTDLPHFWTHDGTLHVELPKLPESISVRLPDVRDREVGSARVWQYTLGAGTCHNTQSDFDFMCSECGKCVDNGRVLGFNFCPRCGRRIVEVDDVEVDE
jgi:hypothetical protein